MRLTPSTAAPTSSDLTDLARHGRSLAIATWDQEITYLQLSGLVDEAVRWLGTDRRLVLLEAGNDVDTVVWYLAALAGRHPVLICDDQGEAASALLQRYDPDVKIRRGEPHLRHQRPAHRLHDELALLLSTSGSTGSPRLVRLSHENVASNAASIAAYLELSSGDRAITSLPMHYCYGLSVLNSHFAVGASVTLTEHSVVDPRFWDLFTTSSVTGLAGVPHTFALLDRVGFDTMTLPSLRYVTEAGGRLAPEAVRRYAELGARSGWDLYVMYGQTEATARIAYLPPSFAIEHPQAVGVAIPGGSITIEPVPECDAPGHGEVVYQGPNVMLGYTETPGELAEGRTVHELRTGDLGFYNSSGLLEITGRRSRFAKLYGLRVDLATIEDQLEEVGIRGLCVSDDVRLCVAVEGSWSDHAVRAHVQDVVALPACAVHVVAVDRLPRLPTGKPDYVAVAAHLRQIPEEATANHDNDLRSLFGRALGLHPTDIAESDTFVALGGDSLSYVELSLELEDALGQLPAEWQRTSIAELRRLRPRRATWWRQVDTSVTLRAIAIVLIVGNHVGLFRIPGGAHVLLAVAGYNLARFGLEARSLWPGIARIVVPTVTWIGLLAATTDDYSIAHVLLVNTFVGPRESPWAYWFLETLVLFLVVVAAAMSIPAVRRFERRHAFPVAVAVLTAGLAIRFDVIDLPTQYYRLYRPQEVLWLFALGWAAARASRRQQVLLTAVAVAAVWNFSSRPLVNVVVGVGVLVLLWCPTLPLPRAVAVAASTLAAGSLAIYLVHYQVYPHLATQHDVVAVAASLATGIVTWQLLNRLHPLRRLARIRVIALSPSQRRGAAGLFGVSAWCRARTPW